MQPCTRVASTDYIGIMTSLGFSEEKAETMYQELMNVSRGLSRKRQETRSILVG
jgi:hypothetical protein